MDDSHSVERKLALLKESLDAGIIDREEYEANRERLEQQARKTAEQKEPAGERAKELSKEPPKGESESSPKHPPKQPAPQEKKEQLPVRHEPKPASLQEKKARAEEKPAKKREEHAAPEAQHPQPESTQKEQPTKRGEHDDAHADVQPKQEIPQQKSSRLAIVLWIAGALLLLGMLVFFSIALENTARDKAKAGNQSPAIACFTLADCKVLGNESRCANPGTPDAYCEHKEIVVANLTVLNAKDCAECGTSRVTALLKEWFPGAAASKVDASSPEGKALIKSYGITMLPAYVLGAGVENSLMFQDVKSAFRAAGGAYVMKDGAAGAVLYLGRADQLRVVDVFLAPEEESSRKAILNMEEFAGLFSGEATLRVHITKGTNASEEASCVLSSYPVKAFPYLSCVAQKGGDCLASNGISGNIITSCIGRGEGRRLIERDAALQKSLGLPVPSFLLNNNLRISGVQAADSLREQYCSRNPSPKCPQELKKSLVA